MMPKLARDKSSVLDEIFNDNYPAMKRWATVVAKNDEPLSEDLVHDVFIKFKRSSSELTEIENIKGFLFTAIRNTYFSKMRQKTLRGEISISEDVPVTTPGLIHDPRISNAARDQLLDICYYACRRKEKSLSASILLLRYFHGYYPAEIKKIAKRSQNSVEARMSKIRAEVADHLDGIEQKVKRSQGTTKKANTHSPEIAGDDVLNEIRSLIFSYPSGRCLAIGEWRKLYLKCDEIGREDLSHLVSCPNCLEAINVLLRLPVLSQRHPFDTCHVPSMPRAFDQARAVAFAVLMALLSNATDLRFAFDLDLLT